MKLFTTYIPRALIASQIFVGRALAQTTTGDTAGDSGGGSGLDIPTIPGLATQDDIKITIIDILIRVLDFVMLLAIVYVVIAGIRLIVSGGDEGQKDTAKKTIIYVIVGILVILLARVIVAFVAGLIT